MGIPHSPFHTPISRAEDFPVTIARDRMAVGRWAGLTLWWQAWRPYQGNYLPCLPDTDCFIRARSLHVTSPANGWSGDGEVAWPASRHGEEPDWPPDHLISTEVGGQQLKCLCAGHCGSFFNHVVLCDSTKLGIVFLISQKGKLRTGSEVDCLR